MRLLVLATYRPADMTLAQHPFLAIRAICRRTACRRRFRSASSTRADVERYLAMMFPEHRFPGRFAALIHAKTEGNPLFMADVVRYLRDSGSIVEREGHWVLTQTGRTMRDGPAGIGAQHDRAEDRAARRGRSPNSCVAASVQGHEFDSASSRDAWRWTRPKSRNGSTRSSTCTCSSSAPGSTSSPTDADAPVSVRPRALPERALWHAAADPPCGAERPGRARARVAPPGEQSRSPAGSAVALRIGARIFGHERAVFPRRRRGTPSGCSRFAKRCRCAERGLSAARHA